MGWNVEVDGREILLPWEINELNQMETNLIFSFPLIILIGFILWQLFSILTTESNSCSIGSPESNYPVVLF